jgi:cyclase
MDADGTKNGFDLDLLSRVQDVSSVPLIISGGAGSVQDFVLAAKAGASAVLAASVFHSGELTISEVKIAMRDQGLQVRL